MTNNYLKKLSCGSFALLLGFVPVMIVAAPVMLPVELNRLAPNFSLAASASAPVADDPRTSELAERLQITLDAVKQQAAAVGPVKLAPRASGSKVHLAPTPRLKPSGSVSYSAVSRGQALKARVDLNVVGKSRSSGTIRSFVPNHGSLEKSQGTGDAGSLKTTFAFLNRQQGALGLQNPEAELHVLRKKRDQLGFTQIRFAQQYRGVPVFGSELIAQLNRDGDLISIHGNYARTPTKLTVTPTLTASQASERVRLRFGGMAQIPESRLSVFSPGAGRARLAWVMTVDVGPFEKYRALVDAHDGTELLVYSLVQSDQASGEGIDLFGQTQAFVNSIWEDGGVYFLADTTKAMYNGDSLPPSPVTSQGIIFVGDMGNTEDTFDYVYSTTGPNGPWLADGVSAAVNLSATYDYFFNQFGRNSLNDQGSNLLAFVRAGQNMPNALFDSSTMTMYFGDAEPYAGALDIVSHEMAHGVISTAIPGGLMYHGQSGALNEAFADIFGESAEAYALGGEPDWLVGSNISAPMRNMADPGALEFSPGRPYPSRMSEYVQPSDPVLNNFVNRDNDGVHFNSSIINHAFYRLTNGTNSISREQAEQIFYRTLTTKLSTQSDFIDMRLGAVQSALELYDNDTADAVRIAFDEVEIFEAPTNPAPEPVPEIDGADATLFVYWDGSAGAYYLGRYDSDLESPPGIQLSANPVSVRSPSVSGDGSFAVFVDAQNDVCLIATDALSAETCLGFAGQISSVAMSPDGGTFGVVFLNDQGDATNIIGVIDIANDQTETYTLFAPVADGESATEVLFADAMDFTSDNRYVLYDAFNQIAFADGNTLGLWSIYAIDRLTGSTIPITTPTPGINAAFPNVAQTSNAHIVFDAVDDSALDTKIVAFNTYTGDAAIVTVACYHYTAPVYSGDDRNIMYSAFDDTQPSLSNIQYVSLESDRLTPSDTPRLWLADALAPAIYRKGEPTAPAQVDLEVTYEATVDIGRPHVTFGYTVSNNGPSDATNVIISISKPENARIDSWDDGINCVEEETRLVCDLPNLTNQLSAHVIFLIEAYSDNRIMTSGMTVFSDEPDTNVQNNTAFAEADENLLNDAPVVVELLKIAS